MSDYWLGFLMGAGLGAQVVAAFVLVLMYRRGMLSPKYPNWM